MRLHSRVVTAALAVAALIGFSACQDSTKVPTSEQDGKASLAARGVKAQGDEPVEIEVFAPENGDHVGQNGVGWFVDIAVVFPPGDLASTGFTGNQLTGPGVHNNAAPLPGNFDIGADDRFGGLIVLLSTNTFGAGSCQNLADLFNLTGPTNIADDENEIWDTWIISTAYAGSNTNSLLLLAEADDLNHDGKYNDAPDVVPDANHDGRCTPADLQAVGLASEVYDKHFFIN